MCVKEAFKIGGQHGEVGRALKVEMGPVRENAARERAFTALARPQDEDGRERPEERPKPLGVLPGHVAHTLHFCI